MCSEKPEPGLGAKFFGLPQPVLLDYATLVPLGVTVVLFIVFMSFSPDPLLSLFVFCVFFFPL